MFTPVTSFAETLAARLNDLASNLWWAWQPEVIAIFRDLDPALWRDTNHNPVAFLSELPPERLARRADETALESRINLAFRRLEEYLQAHATWGKAVCGVLRTRPVAYFSAEFALHESLPIYSGGLGVLAGDHLKGASDLDVPLVAIGIFYGLGYFRQRIDRSGWQQEAYGHVKRDTLPLRRAVGRDGNPLLVEVPLGGETVRVGAWRADVGRSQLILLDSDVERNALSNRALTAQLYGGDARVRFRQEMILGIGGIRMLAALGINPGVLHLNEGHCAFAPLEMARQWAAAAGVAFAVAHREVALRTAFTTHTPVAAGHDRFAPDLVLEHLGWLQREIGLSPEGLLALGRVNPHDPHELFCMTVLGLKSARFANAVSALHGHVTRQMWQSLWPGRRETEVPIGHITNGVHTNSWIAPQMQSFYEHYLGPDWRAAIRSPDISDRVHAIDDAAFWEAHQVVKRRMLNYVLRRCVLQATAEATTTQLDIPHFNGEVLTLAFARRFAEYKRATLLLTDADRLARIVNAPGRPLQILFAGKAHPHDDNGKRILQSVVELSRDPRFHERMIFIADYDFSVARHLVQGCDLWLNTPRRPFEACGTSGQKVLLNGGLNLSVLDGWWAEAYDGRNGFAIGMGEVHSNPAVQDARDAAALYDTLEHEIIPLYYDRGPDSVPHRWIRRVKHAVASLSARFDADRMVRDYVRRCYLPAAGGISSAMPGE